MPRTYTHKFPDGRERTFIIKDQEPAWRFLLRQLFLIMLALAMLYVGLALALIR